MSDDTNKAMLLFRSKRTAANKSSLTPFALPLKEMKPNEVDDYVMDLKDQGVKKIILRPEDFEVIQEVVLANNYIVGENRFFTGI